MSLTRSNHDQCRGQTSTWRNCWRVGAPTDAESCNIFIARRFGHSKERAARDYKLRQLRQEKTKSIPIVKLSGNLCLVNGHAPIDKGKGVCFFLE